MKIRKGVRGTCHCQLDKLESVSIVVWMLARPGETARLLAHWSSVNNWICEHSHGNTKHERHCRTRRSAAFFEIGSHINGAKCYGYNGVSALIRGCRRDGFYLSSSRESRKENIQRKRRVRWTFTSSHCYSWQSFQLVQVHSSPPHGLFTV